MESKLKDRIKELREQKGLSQQKLGELVGVNQQAVSNWETSYREPNIEVLMNLAIIFEVTMDYLVGLNDL
ncbi:MAG: helix-turn-helix transcriptional regulator [Clostridia bacterium]|nr:helix-turn-helix transcriptional regulator [Clostridia bacterium]